MLITPIKLNYCHNIIPKFGKEECQKVQTDENHLSSGANKEIEKFAKIANLSEEEKEKLIEVAEQAYIDLQNGKNPKEVLDSAFSQIYNDASNKAKKEQMHNIKSSAIIGLTGLGWGEYFIGNNDLAAAFSIAAALLFMSTDNSVRDNICRKMKNTLVDHIVKPFTGPDLKDLNAASQSATKTYDQVVKDMKTVKNLEEKLPEKQKRTCREVCKDAVNLVKQKKMDAKGAILLAIERAKNLDSKEEKERLKKITYIMFDGLNEKKNIFGLYAIIQFLADGGFNNDVASNLMTAGTHASEFLGAGLSLIFIAAYLSDMAGDSIFNDKPYQDKQERDEKLKAAYNDPELYEMEQKGFVTWLASKLAGHDPFDEDNINEIKKLSNTK